MPLVLNYNFLGVKKTVTKAVLPSKTQPSKNGTLSGQANKGKPASSFTSESSDDDSDSDDVSRSYWGRFRQ